MAKRMSQLETIEISLVKKGANKKKFIVTKSEDGEDVMPNDLIQKVINTQLSNEEEVDAIFKSENISPKATKALKSAMKILTAVKDDIPPTVMAILGRAMGMEPKEIIAKSKISYPPKDKEQVQKCLELVSNKMDSKKLTGKELATAASVSEDVISNWLGGSIEQVNSQQFEVIAKSLEISEDEYINFITKEDLDVESEKQPAQPEVKPEVPAAAPAAAPEAPAAPAPAAAPAAEAPAASPAASEPSLDVVEKAVNAAKEVVEKALKESNEKVASLTEQILKLQNAPVAPNGSGTETPEVVEKSQKKSIFAGIL